MRFIWATRGRTWGFRFLRDGGFADPLPEYERVFSAVPDEHEAWERVGETVALRFPDPEDRRDGAGRSIPHDFVIFDPQPGQIVSVDDGIRLVWPLVKDEYESLWSQADPGSASR